MTIDDTVKRKKAILCNETEVMSYSEDMLTPSVLGTGLLVLLINKYSYLYVYPFTWLYSGRLVCPMLSCSTLLSMIEKMYFWVQLGRLTA